MAPGRCHDEYVVAVASRIDREANGFGCAGLAGSLDFVPKFVAAPKRQTGKIAGGVQLVEWDFERDRLCAHWLFGDGR